MSRRKASIACCPMPNKTFYYYRQLIRRNNLTLYRVPFADPFQKSTVKGINVHIAKLSRCDRSPDTRISAIAPAIEDQGCLLHWRQEEFEGKKLLFLYQDCPWNATPDKFNLASRVNHQGSGAVVHHFVQLVRIQVRKAL